jgi:5'-3' exonuclease
MTAPPRRLMLLDTASLYFRAFFGVPDSIVAPDGTPVNAVRGLLDFISRLVSDYTPTDLVACWDDDWRPEFRVAAIPSYKAHRVAADSTVEEEEVPDLLSPQVPIIADCLAALGIARLGAPGFEADDVIATLTQRAQGPVLIVTGDRDLFQLVDDARPVGVLYTAARGVGRAELVTEEWIAETYGIPGNRYADFATLRGDPSDGLPGVRGIGAKTAADLLNRFGSISGIQAAAADPEAKLTPSVRRKILEGADYLRIAPTVVEVVRDIPLPAVDSTLPAQPADADRVAELSQRWGLQTPLATLTAALGREAETV